MGARLICGSSLWSKVVYWDYNRSQLQGGRCVHELYAESWKVQLFSELHVAKENRWVHCTSWAFTENHCSTDNSHWAPIYICAKGHWWHSQEFPRIFSDSFSLTFIAKVLNFCWNQTHKVNQQYAYYFFGCFIYYSRRFFSCCNWFKKKYFEAGYISDLFTTDRWHFRASVKKISDLYHLSHMLIQVPEYVAILPDVPCLASYNFLSLTATSLIFFFQLLQVTESIFTNFGKNMFDSCRDKNCWKAALALFFTKFGQSLWIPYLTKISNHGGIL